MWIYVQRTGNIYYSHPPVIKDLKGAGYSGYGSHRYDPASQCIQDLGPLPRGRWTIGAIGNHKTSAGHTLVQSMVLTPGPDTDVCGRSGFFIHGDNQAGVASEGCIVAPLGIRAAIGQSSDRDLTVVAEERDI